MEIVTRFYAVLLIIASVCLLIFLISNRKKGTLVFKWTWICSASSLGCSLALLISVMLMPQYASQIFVISFILTLIICYWVYRYYKFRAVPEEKPMFNSGIEAQSALPTRVIAVGNAKMAIYDDTKKFAIEQKRVTRTFNYSDLLGFELNENNSAIISGRGLQTAVGAATFGVLGAVVGASGKRTQTELVERLELCITVNDIEQPQITIPIIKMQTSRTALYYKQQMAEAKEAVALLNIINKSTQ